MKQVFAILIAFSAFAFTASAQTETCEYYYSTQTKIGDKAKKVQFFIEEELVLTLSKPDTTYTFKNGVMITTILDKGKVILFPSNRKGKFISFIDGVLLIEFEVEGRKFAVPFKATGTGENSFFLKVYPNFGQTVVKVGEVEYTPSTTTAKLTYRCKTKDRSRIKTVVAGSVIVH